MVQWGSDLRVKGAKEWSKLGNTPLYAPKP